MTQPPPAKWPMKNRIVAGTVLAGLYLLLFSAALNIPFSHPSSSILYKFGLDKTMLRGGKMVGVSVLLLLTLQPILVARFTILLRILGGGAHFTLHRLNGFLLSGLVISHPLLVRAAEDFGPIPLAKKYWPEYLGVTLISFLFLVTAGAVWRKKIPIAYRLWRQIHGVSGLILLAGVLVHAHFVSTSFQTGPPKVMLLILAVVFIILGLRLKNKILV